MPVFMKYDGIDGESTNRDHRDWHELMSFQWGETNPPGGGGGGGAGRVRMQDFTVVKQVSKGTPKFFLHCADGRHSPKVEIHVVRTTGPAERTYLKYELRDCFITSYQVGGDGGSVPTESISINFARIEVTYKIFKPDGQVETQTHWWDQYSNHGG